MTAWALQRGQTAIRQLQRDQSGIIPGGAKNHPRAAGAVAQTDNARVITRLPPNPFFFVSTPKKAVRVVSAKALHPVFLY